MPLAFKSEMCYNENIQCRLQNSLKSKKYTVTQVKAQITFKSFLSESVAFLAEKQTSSVAFI